MKKITILLVLLSSMLVVNYGNAADIERGEQLYQSCIVCHGEQGQGNDSLNSPKLAGQKAWYVKRQIKYFQNGVRGSNPKDIYGLQMRPIAMTLENEQDLDAISAYIENLEETR